MPLFLSILFVSAVLTLPPFLLGWIGHWYWFPLLYLAGVLTLAVLFIGFTYLVTRFVNTQKPWLRHHPLYRFLSNRMMEFAMLVLQIKVHVRGAEMLPKEKYLLVCNHRSSMDPLLTMWILRKQRIGFVAKKGIFRIPVIGRLMHTCFCLALDRGNLREEIETINQAADMIKQQTAVIGIYPEGQRNPGNELLPFRTGAFKIAKKAESPIAVAVIRNPEWVAKRAPLRRTHIYLDFIGVLDADFVRANTTAAISDRVREMMEAALAKLPTLPPARYVEVNYIPLKVRSRGRSFDVPRDFSQEKCKRLLTFWHRRVRMKM